MYLNTQWCDYATAGLYFLRTFSANSAATSSPGKKNSPPSPCTNLPAYVFPCVGQASNKSIIKKANPLKDTWYFITVVVSFIFNGCGWTQRKAHGTEWTPRSTGMKFPVTPPHSAFFFWSSGKCAIACVKRKCPFSESARWSFSCALSNT